jgi:hypothetical protein
LQAAISKEEFEAAAAIEAQISQKQAAVEREIVSISDQSNRGMFGQALTTKVAVQSFDEHQYSNCILEGLACSQTEDRAFGYDIQAANPAKRSAVTSR